MVAVEVTLLLSLHVRHEAVSRPRSRSKHGRNQTHFPCLPSPATLMPHPDAAPTRFNG